MRWWWGPLCTRPTRLIGLLIVLAHWNNSLQVDMSPHTDTLFWFQANQSLLFLLNAVCLEEKQQIPISKSLVWPDRGTNPRSTTLEASMLTSIPLMQYIYVSNKKMNISHLNWQLGSVSSKWLFLILYIWLFLFITSSQLYTFHSQCFMDVKLHCIINRTFILIFVISIKILMSFNLGMRVSFIYSCN